MLEARKNIPTVKCMYPLVFQLQSTFTLIICSYPVLFAMHVVVLCLRRILVVVISLWMRWDIAVVYALKAFFVVYSGLLCTTESIRTNDG
jgi:hypothetical protein